MSVTFQYPYYAPTLSITLDNPNLGNSLQLNLGTNFRQTMDGTVYSTIKTPAVRTFTISFSNLVKASLDALDIFYRTALNKEISYTDFDNNIWQGYIVNPILEITIKSNEGGTCIESGSVDIQFTGKLLSAPGKRLLEDGGTRLLEVSGNRLLEK